MNQFLGWLKQSLIIFYKCFKENGPGYVEQLQNTPVKSRRGKGPRVNASSISGGGIKERGNLLCAGYTSTLGS